MNGGMFARLECAMTYGHAVTIGYKKGTMIGYNRVINDLAKCGYGEIQDHCSPRVRCRLNRHPISNGQALNDDGAR